MYDDNDLSYFQPVFVLAEGIKASPKYFKLFCMDPVGLIKSSTTRMKQKVKSSNVFYLLLKQEWGFYIDLTVYILSVIIAYSGFYNPTLNNGLKLETYLKPCWVWRTCAVTITMAWINLLVYMRQMAIFGKYIIILNDIIYTFIKFVVIFIIFVTSFTFGFHVLLKGGGGGGKFDNFRDAFMKTMMMMSGEFDYGDIFFPEDGPSTAPFPDLSYAFFLIFFILLALLLINLLVGLSVNDVAIFVEVASLKKMSMRLKFCLNIERLTKNWIVVGIKKGIYFCFGKRDFLKQKKIGDKVKEMKEEKEDPRSRMWKQVIRENDREEKKNEIEELRDKTDGIEKKVVRIKSDMEITLKKLKEIDDEARRNHDKRKSEMQNMMVEFKTAIDERKDQENMERALEVDRTIKFMENLGKLEN